MCLGCRTMPQSPVSDTITNEIVSVQTEFTALDFSRDIIRARIKSALAGVGGATLTTGKPILTETQRLTQMVRKAACAGMPCNYLKNIQRLRMMQTRLVNGFPLKLWRSLLTTITAFIRQLFSQQSNIAEPMKNVSSTTASLRSLRLMTLDNKLLNRHLCPTRSWAEAESELAPRPEAGPGTGSGKSQIKMWLVQMKKRKPKQMRLWPETLVLCRVHLTPWSADQVHFVPSANLLSLQYAQTCQNQYGHKLVSWCADGPVLRMVFRDQH